MIKQIINWFGENYFTLLIVLLFISMPFVFNQINKTKIETIKTTCTEKCEELGHQYFDSTPEKLFGFKSEDCKCKDKENNIMDIK